MRTACIAEPGSSFNTVDASPYAAAACGDSAGRGVTALLLLLIQLLVVAPPPLLDVDPAVKPEKNEESEKMFRFLLDMKSPLASRPHAPTDIEK